MKFDSPLVHFRRVKSEEFPPVQACIDLDDFLTIMKCVNLLFADSSLRDVHIELSDFNLIILNKFKNG